MNATVDPQDKFELRQAAVEQKLDEHIFESKMYRE